MVDGVRAPATSDPTRPSICDRPRNICNFAMTDCGVTCTTEVRTARLNYIFSFFAETFVERGNILHKGRGTTLQKVWNRVQKAAVKSPENQVIQLLFRGKWFHVNSKYCCSEPDFASI
jgi:hypothetical protein